METITFINSQVAFNNAIQAGFLSTDIKSEVYAGKYMYMYTENNVNWFKHIDTRKYVSFIHI